MRTRHLLPPPWAAWKPEDLFCAPFLLSVKLERHPGGEGSVRTGSGAFVKSLNAHWMWPQAGAGLEADLLNLNVHGCLSACSPLPFSSTCLEAGMVNLSFFFFLLVWLKKKSSWEKKMSKLIEKAVVVNPETCFPDKSGNVGCKRESKRSKQFVGSTLRAGERP